MNSLCPYYRFLWGKCKDLQRKDLINQVFSLGAVVTIKVRENGHCQPLLEWLIQEKCLISEKEIRCDTETLFIDRELSKEHFYGKTMPKMYTKS